MNTRFLFIRNGYGIQQALSLLFLLCRFDGGNITDCHALPYIRRVLRNRSCRRHFNISHKAVVYHYNNDGNVYSVENIWDNLRQKNAEKIIVNGDKYNSYSRIDAEEIAFQMTQTPGNYPLYVSVKNLLVIDNAENNRYVPIPNELKKYFINNRKTANTTEIAKAAQKAGFDGVMFKGIGDIGSKRNADEESVSDVVAVFKSTQVKSAYNNIGTYDNNDGNIYHSDRNTDAIDSRSILANALEGTAQNDVERELLANYQGKIEAINEDERKLSDIRREIKNISFTKGADRSKLTALQNNAKTLADRISRTDKELLKLESTKNLKDLLDREKAKAVKRAEQRGREALSEYREDRKESIAKRSQKDMLDKNIRNTVNWLVSPSKDEVPCPDINENIVFSSTEFGYPNSALSRQALENVYIFRSPLSQQASPLDVRQRQRLLSRLLGSALIPPKENALTVPKIVLLF